MMIRNLVDILLVKALLAVLIFFSTGLTGAENGKSFNTFEVETAPAEKSLKPPLLSAPVILRKDRTTPAPEAADSDAVPKDTESIDKEESSRFLSGEKAFKGGRKFPWLFQLGIRSWTPRFGITVEADSGGVPGSMVDFVDVLGIPDKYHVTMLDAQVRFSVMEFNGAFWHLHTDNRTTLTQQVVYAGQTYNVGTDVTSTLDTDVYQFSVDMPFPVINLLMPGDVLDMRFGVGAVVFDGYGRIRETSGATDSTAADTVFIPVLSLRGRVNPLGPGLGLKQLGIDFDFLGLSYLGAHVFSGSVQLDWQFNRFMSLSYGYNDLNGFADTAVYRVDFSVRGMYLRANFLL